jgi:hypothetical protein
MRAAALIFTTSLHFPVYGSLDRDKIDGIIGFRN